MSITGRRLEARGHQRTASLDIAAYSVPFGIVGGRLWHLITNPQPYFGSGGHPLDALKIWQGGLGIWGAVAFGAVGGWLGCRRYKVPFLDYADSAAPTIALAHAIGRVGNWFNNELYGRPTTKPWGLTIHQWDETQGRAVKDAAGKPVVLGTFQPTFLYELVFLVILYLVLVRIDRVRDLAPGQVFALYMTGYPLGRVVVEMMRTDEANHILGLRVNVWTSLLVFLLGIAVFVVCGRRRGSTEPPDEPSGEPAETPADHDVR